MAPEAICLIILPSKFPILRSGHPRRVVADAEAELLLKCVRFCKYVIANLLRNFSQAGIYPTELILKLFRKANSVSFETVVPILKHHLLFPAQLTLIGMINGRNPLVEFFVKTDVRRKGAEKRNGVLHYGIKFIATVSLSDIEKHALHLGKYLS